MKNQIILLTATFLMVEATTYAQVRTSQPISGAELESHISFLASPFLKGRMNGEESFDIAANYLVSQAKLTGLKPANGESYFQPFTILQKFADPGKTRINVISDSGDSVSVKEPFFHIIPQGPADLDLDGEVVFAGYGIKSDNYNDLENLDIKGKIVIVMNNGPYRNGRPLLKPEFYGDMGFQYKIGALLSPGPRAILFIPEPSSGHDSFLDIMSGLSGYLLTSTSMKGEKDQTNPVMSMMPKVIFADRAVADALLDGADKSLADLQKEIDATLNPQSFIIPGKKISITERVKQQEKVLNNVAAYVEGSHPEKKNEIVVFSAHYDHIGAHGDQVNAGADDDASGCAALLEMAEAFTGLKKKPLRSVLFLWVAGEEIGLYGSRTYVNNPLFPLKQTVADLNMDMIGRTKEEADSTAETPMTGPDGVFVITGGQSSELIEIANEVDSKSSINFDYSLSGRQHPLQLFARSDHYNFVRKDIPVLFFTTGLHSDYHTPGDVIEKLDFGKMERVTQTMFDIGYTVANRKERIIVDNPFSSWEK